MKAFQISTDNKILHLCIVNRNREVTLFKKSVTCFIMEVLITKKNHFGEEHVFIIAWRIGGGISIIFLAKENRKIYNVCHFYAKIIKLGLILTHLSFFEENWGHFSLNGCTYVLISSLNIRHLNLSSWSQHTKHLSVQRFPLCKLFISWTFLPQLSISFTNRKEQYMVQCTIYRVLIR